MIRMIGKRAVRLNSPYCIWVVLYQAEPHPLAPSKRRWAMRRNGRTVLVQEDKFIVLI